MLYHAQTSSTHYLVIPGDVEVAVVSARDDHREAVTWLGEVHKAYATLIRHFFGTGIGDVDAVLELGNVGQEPNCEILH